MNPPIKIIDKHSWDDAISGRSNNPVGEESVIVMADAGKLIVIDEQEHKFVPRRVGRDRWQLEAVTTEMPK